MAHRVLKKYDGKKYHWLITAVETIVILFVAFLLLQLVFGVSFVKGKSMYPTLKNDELAFYTRIVPKYEAGDILSVKMPSGQYFVKRVIAVGGDVVDIKEGNVYVNGKKLKETYLNENYTKKKIGGIEFPYTVEKGKIFVLGDNREVSEDSRDFGAVIRKQIKGKVLFYYGDGEIHRFK